MNQLKPFLALVVLLVGIECCLAVITVQIGGATRLTSLSRQRDRYTCSWNCELIGCSITRDDDECDYDCNKVCHLRDEYSSAAARSGATDDQKAGSLDQMLKGKSAAEQGVEANEVAQPDSVGASSSVRLHLPRNATARNFAIWERCSNDASTGKLTEKPFNL